MPQITKHFFLIASNIFFNFVLLKLILNTSSHALAASVVNTQKQHQQEIQKLRSELNKALENDSQDAGVIVQPSWTLNKGEEESQGKSKVQLTSKNLQEAAVLRAEIAQAVAQDKYATPGVTKTKNIQNLQATLEAKSQGVQMLKTLTGSTGNSLQSEQVGSNAEDQEVEENLKPNIVYANPADEVEIDIRKLQSLVLNKRRTQEVLVLNSIEEDFSFDLGYGVEEWQHIVHKGQDYFIGRLESDVLIVIKEADIYKKAFKLDIGLNITCLETFSYWNMTEQQQEPFLLIAAADKVLWYRVNHTSQEIDLYWLWHMGHNVSGLTYFTLNSQDYLIITSQTQTAFNIYQFQVFNKEFWLAQRIELASSSTDICVLNTGRDVILAVPQNNTAALYSFNPLESAFSHLHFEFKTAIAAEGILTIAGFKMAGHSYLAISGYQPQILLYQQGEFISKTILDSNFGLVEMFLPLPVSTYRDDLLLLVQHRVDFNTHTLVVVETLLWNGDTFETSIPVPCFIGQYIVFGASCILDLHREAGLKGAYQISRGGEISLIVPRHKAESGLFHFYTKLLPKNSELLDLQEMFAFLKEWVKEQTDLVAQAEAFLQMPDDLLQSVQPDFSALEILKTPEFTFSGEVGEIYVNDYKWSQNDSDIELEEVINNLEELEKFVNGGRQRRNLLNAKDVYYESLELDQVTVDELEVATVNGLPFFIQNGQLDFEQGQIEFEELEKNSGEIKDFVRKEIEVNNFVVNGDIEFKTINGINWADIKDNLVFRTEKQTFEELEVKGEIIVETALDIKTLNALNFCEDYLFASGPAPAIVKAEKYFNNPLRVSSVDTPGLINGKNPSDAITLEDNQIWQGMPTFKHLEITEVLELDDEKHGPLHFTSNPTLKESNIIEDACQFNELYVSGSVILQGSLDGIFLGAKLKDIVLKPADPSEEILIPARKTFDMVSWPVDFQLENNTINHIPVRDFVTAHTKQTLHIPSIEGYVYFYNLTLEGSYDNVKIEEILKDIILLDKPIDLSDTELLFPGEVKASNLNVLETLNGEKIKNNLQTLREDLVVKSAEFFNLQAWQADFLNDILGSGKLNNKELHDLVSTKPWHKPPIRGNLFLNELILEKGLQADEIHGIRTEFLYEFLDQMVDLPDMVLNGQIQLEDVLVTGDVQLNKLNGLNFDEELQLTTIWLNRPNYLSNELTFKQRLLVKAPLNVMANYRGFYMPDIIDDMVLRSPSNASIEIKAPKSFLKPVKVLQNTQAKALNGIPLQNIAWRPARENHFKGSLQIKGNLWARNLHIQGRINDFKWPDMESMLYFDERLKKLVLKDVVEFNQSLSLNDLTVLGNLNDIPNLSDFFEHLIYKNTLCLLKGKNTFTGRVSIEKGAYIKNLNGLDLMQLFNNLVFIHGYETVQINAPVIFEDVVRANEAHIKNYMELKDLNECSLREWLNNTLRVDRDYNIKDHVKFAAGSLDSNYFKVHFLNNVNLNKILTLYTPQIFNNTVKFSNIFLRGFINVKGLVNKVDLEMEYSNTLMTYGNQHIHTPINIQSIKVLKDLIVKGPVNKNKNLQDVVTLQTEDIVLESPIYFESLHTPQLITKDLVTGIDLEKWFRQAVLNHSLEPQNINGNWSAKNFKINSAPFEFQYVINGLEPDEFNAYISTARNEDNSDKKEICEVLKKIWHKIVNRISTVKYIEEVYDLKLKPDLGDFNGTINYVDCLSSPGDDRLLLLNLDCSSLLYQWQPELNQFIYRSSFSSGPIDHIEQISSANKSSEQLEFIISHRPNAGFNCTFKPMNIWSVTNNGTVIPKHNITLEFANQIFISSQDNSTLWCLNNGTLKEYDLTSVKIKHSWQLNAEGNKTDYRFVDLKANDKLLMSNGLSIVLLNKKSSQLTNHQPSTNQSKSDLMLKANVTVITNFLFDDFTQYIEGMVLNLRQRLNQQVNITQLRIPETDIVDEHLLPDFMLLMQELQQQNILSSAPFKNNLDSLQVLENPAQVLAARIVKMLKEIAEIHSYLETNNRYNHALCLRFIETLRSLIKDVIKMAHEEEKDINNSILNKIIERIHEFESELEELVKDFSERNQKNNQEQPTQAGKLNKAETFMPKNEHFLPAYQQGEILSLEVGSISQPLNLWAVTNNANSNGISIYLQTLEKDLYQIINAAKPRSLEQLRLKEETFLMFIENCCQVNILRYWPHDSKGFVKYAEIQSDEEVKHIKVIDLPSNNKGFMKYYLVLVLENQLKFYEFVLNDMNWDPILSKILKPLDSCS